MPLEVPLSPHLHEHALELFILVLSLLELLFLLGNVLLGVLQDGSLCPSKQENCYSGHGKKREK